MTIACPRCDSGETSNNGNFEYKYHCFICDEDGNEGEE